MDKLQGLKEQYYNLVAKATRSEADKRNMEMLKDTIEVIENSRKARK